jgi:hypothetical protein
MLFAQLTHAIGLSDVCDALRLHSGPLSALRGATAPSRNNLTEVTEATEWELGWMTPWLLCGNSRFGESIAQKSQRSRRGTNEGAR